MKGGERERERERERDGLDINSLKYLDRLKE
jgi:hypothetical protein